MKQINFFLFFILISINSSLADINKDFENWKIDFKKIALKNRLLSPGWSPWGPQGGPQGWFPGPRRSTAPPDIAAALRDRAGRPRRLPPGTPRAPLIFNN